MYFLCVSICYPAFFKKETEFMSMLLLCSVTFTFFAQKLFWKVLPSLSTSTTTRWSWSIVSQRSKEIEHQINFNVRACAVERKHWKRINQFHLIFTICQRNIDWKFCFFILSFNLFNFVKVSHLIFNSSLNYSNSVCIINEYYCILNELF